jgi:hypothetical protein
VGDGLEEVRCEVDWQSLDFALKASVFLVHLPRDLSLSASMMCVRGSTRVDRCQ